jgi:hypothetical protein
MLRLSWIWNWNKETDSIPVGLCSAHSWSSFLFLHFSAFLDKIGRKHGLPPIFLLALVLALLEVQYCLQAFFPDHLELETGFGKLEKSSGRIFSRAYR